MVTALLSRLPRRHAQRQALRNGRNAIPLRGTTLQGLPSQASPLVVESRVRKKKSCNWDIDFDSDVEPGSDSGYGSVTDNDKDEARYREEEARLLEEMESQFEQEGLTMSNPYKETFNIIEKE